jgi:hypothetical protein
MAKNYQSGIGMPPRKAIDQMVESRLGQTGAPAAGTPATSVASTAHRKHVKHGSHGKFVKK